MWEDASAWMREVTVSLTMWSVAEVWITEEQVDGQGKKDRSK
jgi:hypothetical protein